MASSGDGEKPTAFTASESVLRDIRIHRTPGVQPAEQSMPHEGTKGTKGTQHHPVAAEAGTIRDVSMLDRLRSQLAEKDGR